MILYPAGKRIYKTVGEIINDWNAGISFSREKNRDTLIDRNEVERIGIKKIEFHFEGKRRKSAEVSFEGGIWE